MDSKETVSADAEKEVAAMDEKGRHDYDCGTAASSWAYFEFVNSVVHELEGEQPEDVEKNFLVAGRTGVVQVYLPPQWKLRTVDGHFKIVDEKDAPPLLTPHTVFNSEYIEKEHFVRPRVLPRTERLRTDSHVPQPDPREKGKLVVREISEKMTTAEVESDETDDDHSLVQEKTFRVVTFNVQLPARELRLMIPTKGRRPHGPARYHMHRLAFGHLMMVLENDSPSLDERLVMVGSPLLQFYFRLEPYSGPGIRGPARWRVELPAPRYSKSAEALDSAVSQVVSRTLAFLQTSTSGGHESTSETRTHPRSESTILFSDGQDESLIAKQTSSNRNNRAGDDSAKEQSDDGDHQENIEERSDRRKDLTDDSSRKSVKLFDQAPVGPRERRPPKWRLSYVSSDLPRRDQSPVSPTASVKTRSQASDSKTAQDLKQQHSSPKTTQAPAKAVDKVVESRVQKSSPTTKTRIRPKAASRLPELDRSTFLDMTESLRFSLIVFNDAILCPYQNCPTVLLHSARDIGAHLVLHIGRGDVVLKHLLHSEVSVDAPTLHTSSLPSARSRPLATTPAASSVRKISWEDTSTVQESRGEVGNSVELWYDMLIPYSITEAQAMEDCESVGIDGFGMKQCPVARCGKVFPAYRLAEHYRTHFCLVTIERKRGRKGDQSSSSGQQQTPHQPAHQPSQQPAQQAISVQQSTTNSKPKLDLPRAPNGRFAKRSKANGGPAKKKRKSSAPTGRKRGRPRKYPRPDDIPASSVDEPPKTALPVLEPGKATAYDSANVLRRGALYTAVAVQSESEEDVADHLDEMDEDDDEGYLTIDGIAFGAMSE